MGAEATQVTMHFEFNLLPTISFYLLFSLEKSEEMHQWKYK